MLQVTVKRNQYQDSVRLMAISREAGSLPGVKKVLALLGTESNKHVVGSLGLVDRDVEQATPNDLLVCVEASDPAAAGVALERVDALLRKDSGAGVGEIGNPASVEEASSRLAGASLALFSVPGPFAKLDVVAALEQGLDVMLFSDNVSIEDERFLKTLAASKGLLLMGPDCGTAIIHGVALAFANVVRRGDVGVVGASGTGIQEVTCLVERMGGGISHAIGVGGRDLKKRVGGIMMSLAIQKLALDPMTRRLVIVSKPGDPEVVRRVLEEAAATRLEVVACFLGGAEAAPKVPGVGIVDSLEGAALAVMGREEAEHGGREEAVSSGRAFPPSRRYLRGLYSGGTLCYEALLLAEGRLAVESNIAPRKDLCIPHPARGRAHCCVDLGDDEFTVGRPHPMIDSTLRKERIVEDVRDPSVRVILLDVVLGYGASANPAGDIVDALAEGRAGLADDGPMVIAHVCGTEGDPQVLGLQEAKLREAGVLVFPSNAAAVRAALTALEAA